MYVYLHANHHKSNSTTTITFIMSAILFGYLLFCYLLSKVFSKVQSLQYPSWWAFIPFINIYILTTKVCHFSDVYFFCMVVFTLITGIGGIILYITIMLELGKLFNHSKCWSFWLLFMFAPIGFAIIAFKKDESYRWDVPILEPPNAVFHRVTNPEYIPPQLPISHHNKDESVYYVVPGVDIEDNIYIKQQKDGDMQISPNSTSKSVKVPKRQNRLMSRYNRIGESPFTPPEEIV